MCPVVLSVYSQQIYMCKDELYFCVNLMSFVLKFGQLMYIVSFVIQFGIKPGVFCVSELYLPYSH